MSDNEENFNHRSGHAKPPVADTNNEDELTPAMKRALQRQRALEEQRQHALEEKRAKEEENKNKEEEKQRRKWERNYSSEDSKIEEENLALYYCAYCATFCLLLDCDLELLPKRSTDAAHVLNEETRLFKRVMEDGGVKKLKRAKGIETQYRLQCKTCGLLLCYRSKPVEEKTKFCYIVSGALTSDPTKLKTVKAALAPVSEAQEDEVVEDLAKTAD